MSSIAQRTPNHTISLSSRHLLKVYFDLFSDVPIQIINSTTCTTIDLNSLRHSFITTYEFILNVFQKYIYSFIKPLDTFKPSYIYKQSKYLKYKLKQHQINAIQHCIHKENNPSTLEFISNFTVITDDGQSGKSFIPLELSSYPVKTDLVNVLQTTLIIVPSLIKEVWKTKLELHYLNKYYILDSQTKLNTLLRIDDKIISGIKRTKIINSELIKDCKIILIDSTYFNEFNECIKESELYFARIVFDSFFNIDNITTLYPELFIKTYIITNQINKLITQRNSYIYSYIKTGYSYNDHKALSCYTKLLYELYNDTIINKDIDITNKLIIEEPHAIELKSRLWRFKTALKNKITIRQNTILYIKNIDKSDISYYEYDYKLYEYNKYKPTTIENIIIKLLIEGPKSLTNTICRQTIINNIQKDTYDKTGIESTPEKEQGLCTRIECNECPICLDSVTNKIVTGCCNNSFCIKCYLFSIKVNEKCPLCRKVFTSLSDHYIMEQNIVAPSPIETINSILDSSILFNNHMIVDTILKSIKLSSKKSKIIIIDINSCTYEFSRLLRKHNITYTKFMNYSNEEYNTPLQMFIHTDIIECLIINHVDYYKFIEYGFTFNNIDYIISNTQEPVINLPKIINSTTLVDKKIKHIRIK